MMRNILTHANPEWRQQRSTCARILDPKNQDRMKRRKAGVVHTNWDNLMVRWSGSQRWWEVSNDWKSFVKTAEELCTRTLGKHEDKKRRECSLTGSEDTQSKAEMERKKNKKKEREKLRMWDLARGNQMRIQIWGDPNLIVNWINGKWKINNRKFRTMVQKTQNMLDKTDIRPMGDHLDMFEHVYRVGIRRLIILCMWQERREPHGIPVWWKKELELKK